jgi:hypothetical protein
VTAQWFLAGVPESNRPAFMTALHHGFLVLGALTVASSLSFHGLQPADGSNVSPAQTANPAAGRETGDVIGSPKPEARSPKPEAGISPRFASFQN